MLTKAHLFLGYMDLSKLNDFKKGCRIEKKIHPMWRVAI